MDKIKIAIDGYSSCGKSTLAKQLAAKLGYIYVDTGAMYRAVTLYCMERHIIEEEEVNSQKVVACLDEIDISFRFNEELNKHETFLNGRNVEQEIREMDVSSLVSKISIIKEVRQKLVKMQRSIGTNNGVVMEGRDIGTVVFPDAELKLFLTANKEVRTRRRYEELKAKGLEITMEEISQNLDNRDHADTSRKENPLVQAKDAIVLDNTNINEQEQLEFALKLVEERLS